MYKVPDIAPDWVDHLANVFLIGTDVDELQKPEQDQARNLTKSIFVVQQRHRSVTLDFVSDVTIKPNVSGGAINAVGRPLPLNRRVDICANKTWGEGRWWPDNYSAVQHHASRRL